MPSRPPASVQLLVIGDCGTGKSALIETFVTEIFPEHYYPNAYNTWSHRMELEGRQLNLSIWDPGSTLRPELRALSYYDKHVVLFCYDSSKEQSLVNVIEKWMPEVFHYLPDTPWLLVSCKNDLRADPDRADPRDDHLVPPMASAASHAALACSAKNAQGVRDVFEVAARLGLEHAKLHGHSGRQSCCLQ